MPEPEKITSASIQNPDLLRRALGYGTVAVSAQTIEPNPETIVSVARYAVVPSSALPEDVLIEKHGDMLLVSSKASVRPLGPEKDDKRPRTESELVRNFIRNELAFSGRPLMFRPRSWKPGVDGPVFEVSRQSDHELPEAA